MNSRCRNCADEMHVPDVRTGLIHRHGKYACFGKNEDGKKVQLETVAE